LYALNGQGFVFIEVLHTIDIRTKVVDEEISSQVEKSPQQEEKCIDRDTIGHITIKTKQTT
jgi:hypothetical protein